MPPIIRATVIKAITVHQRCRLVVRMTGILVRERHARIWIRLICRKESGEDWMDGWMDGGAYASGCERQDNKLIFKL